MAHSARHDARHPLVPEVVGEAALPERPMAADRGHPRRPAGRHLRPGGVRRRRLEEHTAPATSCSSEPAPTSSLGDGLVTFVAYRCGDEPAASRARRLDRRDRFARAVAARQPRHHPAFGRRRELSRRASTTTGGAYFGPASLACSPRTGVPTRRGALVGLTRFRDKGHIARAALESTAFQTATSSKPSSPTRPPARRDPRGRAA